MAVTPTREFRLMRWFALAGAAAIGLFCAVMALLLGQFLATTMLARDAALSRDFVQSIANTQQVEPVFRAPDGKPGSAFVEFFSHLAAMPDVLRANVYSAGRRVLWSSRPELIGRVFGDNDELDAALAGRVVAHIDRDASKSEHLLLANPAREFVENYLPVYDPAGRQLIGVVELYRQPAALFQAIRSGQQLLWGGAVLGALFLYASLIWFVRRADRALREQRARLVEAEALAMVGELSASVAHSIRNPLGSIRSTAELQFELGAEPQAMGDIMRQVDRIDRLLRELLSSTRETESRDQLADLGTVLAQVRLRFEPVFAAKDKQLRFDVIEPLGAVAADPLLLTQVFDSLLSNADEATEAGDQVMVRARRDADVLRLEVRDSGRGLGSTDREQLFKPLYTTKPHGLGMGLALVRRVVLRLGGQIALANAAERGTVVSLTLPLLTNRAG